MESTVKVPTRRQVLEDAKKWALELGPVKNAIDYIDVRNEHGEIERLERFVDDPDAPGSRRRMTPAELLAVVQERGCGVCIDGAIRVAQLQHGLEDEGYWGGLPFARLDGDPEWQGDGFWLRELDQRGTDAILERLDQIIAREEMAGTLDEPATDLELVA